jgi:hypothetical protein
MVLDAKALTWAARNNIDTAKLKAARVPIFGKWYFPEIPAGVPLVNLETGEHEVFPERMLAGELIYAPLADLRRAALLPADFPVEEPAAGDGDGIRPGALHVLAPEPLLAIARPPGLGLSETSPLAPPDPVIIEDDPAEAAGIHMPSASISPFVLGVGFCILMLGVITNPVIAIAGLAWMVAGAIGWIRIGLQEQRAAATTHGRGAGH